MEYQSKMGVAVMQSRAIQACVGHFNLGPVDNQCLGSLMIQIANGVVQGTFQF